MSSMQQRIIFLPVEIVERELDAKLLVALEALERGYVVYIGNYQYLPEIAKKVGGGFYLYKAMTDYRAKNLFLPLADRSVCSGVLDEEGLIFPSLDYYARTRIGAGDSIPVLSKIYMWGEVQSKFVEERFSIDSTKIVVTGNPRIDLLRSPYNKIYDVRAKAIAERYGDFVLVNTNFGPGNYSPNFGFTYHEHMRYFGRISTQDEEVYYSERTKYFEKLFFDYVEMVGRLAEKIFPLKVIVRPHPVEDHERWRRLLSGFENVHIVFEGSAIDWIVASKCLIHTGCTTGVESFILEKPIFRYNKALRLDMESNLPNSLGESFVYLDELVDRVCCFLNGGKDESTRETQSEYLSGWIQNLNGAYSFERILDSIDREGLGDAVGCGNVQSLDFRYVRLVIRNALIRSLGRVAKRFAPIARIGLFRKAVERMQRFPGIRKKMLRDRIFLFYHLKRGAAPENVRVTSVGPDVFQIQFSK